MYGSSKANSRRPVNSGGLAQFAGSTKPGGGGVQLLTAGRPSGPQGGVKLATAAPAVKVAPAACEGPRSMPADSQPAQATTSAPAVRRSHTPRADASNLPSSRVRAPVAARHLLFALQTLNGRAVRNLARRGEARPHRRLEQPYPAGAPSRWDRYHRRQAAARTQRGGTTMDRTLRSPAALRRIALVGAGCAGVLA